MKYIIDCMGKWDVSTIYSHPFKAEKEIARHGSQSHCYAVRSLPENMSDWEKLVKESPIYKELISLRKLKAYHDLIKKDVLSGIDYEISI